MKFLITFLLIGLISPLSAMNIRAVNQETVERDMCYKILDCLNFVDRDFSIEAAVEDLYQARELIVKMGYAAPSLSAIFEKTFEDIEGQGISLDRSFLEEFYESVLSKENYETKSASFFSYSQYCPKVVQVKRETDKEEFRVPDGVAIGFCKALAGGLMCIIPSGVTQTIGTGLVLSGINDMLEHANDPISERPGGSWEDDLNRRQRMGTQETAWIPLNQVRQSHGIISV